MHHYRISPVNPAAHLFEVELRITSPDPAGQALRMPAWIPGSYMIRDYARNVVSVKATSGGKDVQIEKRDKSTWVAAPCDNELIVTAEIFAYDPSVRGAHLDRCHGFFNGTAMFFEVVGQEDTACELEIEALDGIDDWQVVSSLKSAGAEPYGFGRYAAANYDELIDQPVEMAPQLIREFTVAGIPHALAIRGPVSGDVDRLVSDLSKVLEEHHNLFGAPDDLDRYVFLLNAPVSGYGGLEHRWSSANICSRDSIPMHGDASVSDGYRQLLGLLSHEYFHLWNIKRIKPDVFTPYALQDESYTKQLWVYEGVTSYYDDLALVRSGVITPESYFELIGQTVTRVLGSAGRKRQSVAESSFDAWIKFYKQDANGLNSIVSYYAKGSLIILALDLIMRAKTEATVDAVMRECFSRYGAGGMPEDGFEVVCKEVSGLDLDDFFARYVYGTEDPPLADLLAPYGVSLKMRKPAQVGDKGGKAAEKTLAVAFGAILSDQNGHAIVQTVSSDSPAERAGLAPQDELLAIDNLRLSTGALDRRLRDFKAGQQVELSYFRNDQLMTSTLEFAPSVDRVGYFELADDAPDARVRWFASASA